MQVPLEVIPENETSYEGMIGILEELQKYIPSKLIYIKEKVPGSELSSEKNFITTLVGGDYLSTARAQGVMLIRANSELQEHALKVFFASFRGLACQSVSMGGELTYNSKLSFKKVKLCYRLYGSIYSQPSQLWRKEHFFSSEM